ncbi:MAG: radical SAM protein [Candidatus Bathyarchaeota archaeon]|nr:radical SAM protein [Candidatus Bathyarchaeota archaeon]
MECRLAEQGLEQGSCLTLHEGRWSRACEVTLMWRDGTPHWLIHSYAHKAPEQYLSIYQSGCNWSCRKCHSWRFSKRASGGWMSPGNIAKISEEYAEKNVENMYMEPRERATSWHAHDLCRSCGSCITTGARSRHCLGKLRLDQMTLLDDMTWGPAMTIISFTGGDLACQPEFYALSAEAIKGLGRDLWVLFETNGYGLTPGNLDTFREAGIDSFWLDIKAHDGGVHRRLMGCPNDRVLELPAEIVERGFFLEVSTVCIPGWVEADQIGEIAGLLAGVDPETPYGIIAFIPENEMREVPSPDYGQMVGAFEAARDAGLRNVRVGNLGCFVRDMEQYEALLGMGAI